jgi:putative ABC transport system permease protein
LKLVAGPEVSLAFKLSTANRRRTAVTLAGASLAVSLIIYQLFLIVGFIGSSSALIRSIDAELWVLAHEAQAFDFSAPARRDLAFGIAGIEGVADTEPVVSGFANAIDARGKPSVVALAGLPVERFHLTARDKAAPGAASHGGDRFVFIDRTALGQFDAVDTPFDLEISGERVVVARTMDGYATFLGSPFLVTSTSNARRWLRLGPDDCTGIAVWIKEGASIEETQGAIRRAYPELTVLTTWEYAARSAVFWLTKTGAGGGLLLSAILGFGIGMLIISQNLYASVLESIQQYTTLRAMGLEASTLRRVVIAQSTSIALVAGIVGAALAYLFAGLTRIFVLGWIAQPPEVPLLVLAACAFMGLASSFSAVRLIHALEPAHALRQ